MIDKMENKDKEAFKVPEGYFEDLTDTLMEKVSSKDSHQKVSFFTLVRPHLMMAASMAIFVIVSYTLLKTFLPSADKGAIDSDLAFYEDYFGSELEEEEIYSLLAQADNTTELDTELSDDESEEIIDFLIDQEISFEEISTID